KLEHKRYRDSSLNTYRSWWKGYRERLAAPRASGDPREPGKESAIEMAAAIEGAGDYLSQKRTFALVNWIYQTLNAHGHPLTNPCSALEGLFMPDMRTDRRSMTPAWHSKLTAAASELASGWKRARLIAVVHVLKD